MTLSIIGSMKKVMFLQNKMGNSNLKIINKMLNSQSDQKKIILIMSLSKKQKDTVKVKWEWEIKS